MVLNKLSNSYNLFTIPQYVILFMSRCWSNATVAEPFCQTSQFRPGLPSFDGRIPFGNVALVQNDCGIGKFIVDLLEMGNLGEITVLG